MAAGGVRRLSGLQRQVLGLYRDVLRAARTKDAEARASIQQYARSEIDSHMNVDRKNHQLIEHLVRKGRRQLDLLRQPSVTGVQLHGRS